jgi:hypothetical protein
MMVVPSVLDRLRPLDPCPAQLALPRPRILPRACSDTIEYFGSSLNRVGDFWGWMSDKAVHCLGILHFDRLGIWHQ